MFEFWGKLTRTEKVKYVSSRLGLVMIVLFCVFNWKTEEVHFIFFRLPIPQTLLILIAFGLGILVSFMSNYKVNSNKDHEIKMLREQADYIAEKDAEIEQLKKEIAEKEA